MTDFVLKAKHWQVFLVLFAVPYFLQLMIIPSDIEPENLQKYVIMMIPFALYYLISNLTWYWAVGIGLLKKTTEEKAPKSILFKISIIGVIMIYVSVFAVMIRLFDIITQILNETVEPEKILPIAGILLILMLMLLIGFIYMFVFTARSIYTAETQEKAKFKNYIAEFILVWFLPVGVWFLQPRINKIVREDNE